MKPAYTEQIGLAATILDTVAALVVVLDSEGRIIHLNRTCATGTGYSLEEVKDQYFWNLLLIPDQAIAVREIFQNLSTEAKKNLSPELPNPHTHCWVIKDGSRRWISWSTEVSLNAESEINYISVTGVDITDRVQEVEALREEKERFRRLSEATYEGIVIHSNGMIEEANGAIAPLFGYDDRELIGKNGLELIAPEFRKLAIKHISSGYEKPYEVVGVKKDGSTFPLEVQGKTIPYQGRTLRVTAMRDITERKQAEEARRESERRFKTLAEVSPVGIFHTNAEGHCTYVNKRWCEIADFTPEEAAGEGWTRAIHPDDAQRVFAEWYEAAQANRPFKSEYRFLRPDGVCTWVLGQAKAVKGKGGEVSGYVGTTADITDRKQAEAALQEWNKELEMRVAQRTAEVNRAAEQLTVEMSDRLRAEEALKASESRFRTMFEQSPLSIQIVSLTGQTLQVNRAWEELWGIALDELANYNLLQDEQLVAYGVMPYIQRGFAGEACEIPAIAYNLKNTAAVQTGIKCWVRGFIYPVKDEFGLIREVILIHENVSDRILAEEALKESESRLHAILDNSPALFYLKDMEGRSLFVNRAFETLFKLSREQVFGKTDYYFLEKEIADAISENDRKVFAAGKPLEFEEMIHQDDGLHTYISLKFPLYNAAGIPYALCGMSADITDRKHAEAALKESEERFRATFEQAAVGIARVGRKGRWLEVNQKLCDILGYTREEILKKTFLDITPSEDRNNARESMQKWVAGEMQTATLEKCYIRKDESRVWAKLTVSRVGNSSGELKYLIVVIEDISDRKALERELAMRQARFDAFFKAVPVGLIMLSDDLRYLHVNEAMAAVNGVPVADHLGKSIAEVVPGIDPMFEQMFRRFQETGESVSKQEMSIPYPTQPNVMGYWIVSYFPLPDSDGTTLGIGAVVGEITDRKLAEEAMRRSQAELKEKNQQLEQTLHELQRTQAQLIQTEKMSSLGQLVAGVAHEINNPTSFIYGNIDPAREYTEDLLNLLHLYQEHYPQPLPEIQKKMEAIDLDFLMEDLPKLLESMKMGATRIRDIVLSLRNFSRLDEADMKPVDIHSGIDSTLMILQNRLKDQGDRTPIQIVKEYGQLPPVECYAGQLNQVFMNILTNAIDALETQPDPHFITIRTSLGESFSPRTSEADSTKTFGTDRGSAVNGNQQQTTDNVQLRSEQVVIRIADNGPGMTEEVRKRLFDPFFTTKPIGKGTGLGLAISYQIVVEKHKGSLECFSTPGQGTELAISIPVRKRT